MPNTLYDKTLFFRKLVELGVDGPFVGKVLATLDDQFTLDKLERAMPPPSQVGRGTTRMSRSSRDGHAGEGQLRDPTRPEQSISERIIFPSSPTETNGIEDARFVQFHDDDGTPLLRDLHGL